MPGMPATACLQPRDDRIDAGRAALIARLQRDGEPAGIGRGVERAGADHRDHAGHVRIGADRRSSTWVCTALHFGEGDVGAGLRHRDDHAGVLQRQEALGHDDVEADGGDQRRQRRPAGSARWWRSTQPGCGDRPRPCVDRSRPIAGASAVPPDAARRAGAAGAPHIIGVSVSETIAETTTAIGQREREFAEHAADHAGHEQQRDEHRDQRHGQRDRR